MNATIDTPRETSRPLTKFERGLAVAAAVGVMGIWFLAIAVLSPDPRGIGTHEQLGLAPCRMIAFFGIPCAFCGMTTAFTLLAHGQIIAAFLTQPAAVFIAALTIPAGVLAAFTSIQGAVPPFIFALTSSRRAIAAFCLLIVSAWIYKILAYI